MDVLLRELREGRDGFTEYHDTEISGAELTIGSAPDQNIQLQGREVAAEHAVIRQVGTRLELTCRRGQPVRVNRRKRVEARLSVGDVIELSAHRLQLVEPPPGFALAIEMQTNDRVAATEFESAFRTDLAQTWLGKRAMAWAGVVLVLLVGLALPMLVMTAHHEQKPVPKWLLGDEFWNSGPLHQVHQQAIGDRCDTCHQKLFQHVQDGACVECHRTIHDHIEPERLRLTQLGPTPRCATCHREHNEPQDFLVNTGDSQCVACHAQPEHGFGDIKKDPVRGFGLDRHPEFKAHLLASVAAPSGTGIAYDWQSVIVPLDGASEQSNLKFSHHQHLDPQQVLRRGDSQPMNCADCHRLEDDGEHFQPVSMEAKCSGCHELTFDPAAPDRQLPHGKPREAVLTLQDYFTRKFSDPNAGRAQRDRRRLPGQESQEETCNGAPFDCAMRAANKEIESQFTRRGCVGCHAVIDTKAQNVFDRFQVVPIRFARDYFPANRFNHSSHEIQGKLIGDAACSSCHRAKQSTDSSDLMIPGLTQCTECHGDKSAVERITLQCVSCHDYHPRQPPQSPLPKRPLLNRLTRDETKTAPAGEPAGS